MIMRLIISIMFCGVLVECYVLNSDPQYQRWPNGKVPFYVKPGDYTQAELNIIGQAMTKMTQDLGGCVQFIQLTQLPAAGTMNHVVLSKSGGPGVPSPTCFSYPGNVVSQNGLGQHMSIQGGQSGCLSDARHVMRLLASLLGLRSEHNKPNRDQFILVNQQNVEARVQPYVPLNIYDTSKVLSNPNDFDVNSISLIDPVAFSGNGAPVIQSRGTPLLNSGTLSMKDCQALTWFYQCSATCRDPYGAGGLPNSAGLPTNQLPNNQFPNQQFSNGQLQQFPNQQFPNQQFPNQQFPNQQFSNQPQPINQFQLPIQQQLPNQQFQNQPFQQVPINQQFPNQQQLPNQQFNNGLLPNGQVPNQQTGGTGTAVFGDFR